jgi:carboxyl-terminal processing protease
MMTIPQKDREQILNKVDRLVRKKHFNPALNGANWSELVEERRPRILAAETVEGLESEISSLLSRLKTSHTGFFHRSLRTIPARHAINATCRPYSPNGSSAKWMFQDVHAGGAAHNAGMRAGDLLLELNGNEIGPPNQPVFRMGLPARLTIEKLSGERTELKIDVPAPKSKKHPVNQPLAIVCSTIQPGLGLLKVTMFPGAVGIDLAHGFDRAIAALRDCDRLIVDLRGNTGGGIGGLRLMSYLTPDRRPVGYSLTKKRAANGYRREDLSQFRRIPSHKAALLWLLIRYGFVDKSIAVVTEGLGRQPFHGRVVILVNEHSASAAEMLAVFARENNLAKIVGTKTPGRLLSGSAFKVGHGFILGLPVGAYLTWQGTLLEGKGIEPDETVDLGRDALRDGRDTQVEKAIEVALRL